MKQTIAQVHIRALPHTLNSRLGEKWVTWLYEMVGRVGYVYTVKREGKIVGVISGIGRLILTLVVTPEWQRKGIGRELLSLLEGRQYVYTEDCSVLFYEKVGFRRMGSIGGIILLWKN